MKNSTSDDKTNDKTSGTGGGKTHPGARVAPGVARVTRAPAQAAARTAPRDVTPKGTYTDRIRRPGKSVVQTSIRMSRGTRETLNYCRYVLNQNRLAHEPLWSLGEVIELVIDDGYEPWVKIRRTINQNPLLPVREKPRTKSEPTLKRAAKSRRGLSGQDHAGHSQAV